MTEPKQRSWEITGGDASAAMGYKNEFHSLNKAFESLEFLEEMYPDTKWKLKEKN